MNRIHGPWVALQAARYFLVGHGEDLHDLMPRHRHQASIWRDLGRGDRLLDTCLGGHSGNDQGGKNGHILSGLGTLGTCIHPSF